MGDRKTYLTNQIVKYAQKLDQKGFGANHDGNISAICDGTILATPTAVSKGNVVEDIIITLDMAGNKLAGIGKPFSEIKLHLIAYQIREDVNAVVHAHPPYATARGLQGRDLEPALPEAIVSLGKLIPVTPFAMPGDKANDAIMRDVLTEYDVFMLPGNGVFAVGVDVEQAYLRLELVEHLAKIHYLAEQSGGVSPLSSENIAALLQKRVAAGLGPKLKSSTTLSSNETLSTIKKLIAEEIKNAVH